MFNEKKVAQMAAFFLGKSMGMMPVMKLLKLLYLSDRESMNRYGEPITYDAMVSMPNGPVLSRTYEFINGAARSMPEGWESWISDRENHKVSLRREVVRDDLLELSDSDLDVMDSVWLQFGKMDQWQLSNYTHFYCAEWQDPHGSSKPITYQDVFKALGKDATIAAEMQDDILANKQVDRLFLGL